jgi:DNA-binding transcriptional ArsR family regulator
VENQVDARTRITDPQTMRALAHPARLSILLAMQRGQTGTATEFAEVCGLSPSATSYHLRALARAGMVEQADGRGDARERVWRATGGYGGYEVRSGPKAGPEALRAEQELVTTFLAYQEAKLRAWVAGWATETQEWYDATGMFDSNIVVTAPELAALCQAVSDLLEPYRRSERVDPPATAREVEVMFRLVPGAPAS